MMIVQKRTVIYHICGAMDFTTHTVASINESRKKIRNNKLYVSCFACKKKFNDDDVPYLGFVKGHSNVLLCRECRAKVEEESKEVSK